MDNNAAPATVATAVATRRIECVNNGPSACIVIMPRTRVRIVERDGGYGIHALNSPGPGSRETYSWDQLATQVEFA